jgi:hypothetical protein
MIVLCLVRCFLLVVESYAALYTRCAQVFSLPTHVISCRGCKSFTIHPMNNYGWVQYSPPSPHTHHSTKGTKLSLRSTSHSSRCSSTERMAITWILILGKPVLGVDDLLLLLNHHWARDTATVPTERHRVQFALILLLLFGTGCRPAELVDAKKKRRDETRRDRF